jgi:hypothetical protein
VAVIVREHFISECENRNESENKIMASQGFFKSTASAAPSKMSNYIADNTRGTAVICETFIKSKSYNSGDNLVIWKLRIVESVAKGANAVAQSKGDTVSMIFTVQKPGVPGEMARKNLNAAFLAALSLKPSEVDPEDLEEELEQAHGDKQPLRGLLVNFDSVERKTLKGDVRFYTNLSPSGDNGADKVKARRTELDKTAPLTEF